MSSSSGNPSSPIPLRHYDWNSDLLESLQLSNPRNRRTSNVTSRTSNRDHSDWEPILRRLTEEGHPALSPRVQSLPPLAPVHNPRVGIRRLEDELSRDLDLAHPDRVSSTGLGDYFPPPFSGGRSRVIYSSNYANSAQPQQQSHRVPDRQAEAPVGSAIGSGGRFEYIPPMNAPFPIDWVNTILLTNLPDAIVAGEIREIVSRAGTARQIRDVNFVRTNRWRHCALVRLFNGSLKPAFLRTWPRLLRSRRIDVYGSDAEAFRFSPSNSASSASRRARTARSSVSYFQEVEEQFQQEHRNLLAARQEAEQQESSSESSPTSSEVDEINEARNPPIPTSLLPLPSDNTRTPREPTESELAQDLASEMAASSESIEQIRTTIREKANLEANLLSSVSEFQDSLEKCQRELNAMYTVLREKIVEAEQSARVKHEAILAKRAEVEQRELQRNAILPLNLTLDTFRRSDIECICCYEVMEGAIFQCRNGHCVCEECYGRLGVSCCVCRVNLGRDPIRNRLAEEFVKKVKVRLAAQENVDAESDES